MTANYPGSLDTDATVGGNAEPDAATSLDSSSDGHPTHSGLHKNLGEAVQELETKIGIGTSTPAANRVLLSTVTNQSSWGQVTGDMIASSTVAAANLAESYYTETESDARFLRSNADDTMVGSLTIDNDNSGAVNEDSLRVQGDHGTSATIGWATATVVIDDAGQYPSLSWRSADLNYAAVLRLSTAASDKLVLRNANDSGFANLEVGTLTQSSDLTLKTKTGEAPGLDLVNRLAPFAGHWNDQPGEVNFWLGAQEVAEALTGAGFDPAECGVVQDVEDTMGLQYTQLVPVLVKAVQELTARLEAVEG